MKVFLPKARRKNLLNKIANYCARSLATFRDEKHLQNNELEYYVGLKPNRISEILNGSLSEPSLIKLIEGGVVSFKDIDSNVDLDSDEREYLKSFALSENNFEFAKIIAEVKEQGKEEEAMRALKKIVKKK